MEPEPKCAERIAEHWRSTKEDLELYMADPQVREGGNPEGLSSFAEYALGFDYVEPGTFTGQTEGYWRYQMSWGGPSDEIRFYGGPVFFTKAEYWFLDWFDGAKLDVTDTRCVHWLWSQLYESGAVSQVYREAVSGAEAPAPPAQPEPAPKQISFTPDKVLALRRAYTHAVETQQGQFTFEGDEFVTGYAKYLLEYLDNLGPGKN